MPVAAGGVKSNDGNLLRRCRRNLHVAWHNELWRRNANLELRRDHGYGAKRGGTTVPAALRDYSSIEDAARQHPLLGVEALAQRMGWNSRDLAAAYAAQHGWFPGYEPKEVPHITQVAAEYNNTAAAQNMIDEAASHPAISA